MTDFFLTYRLFVPSNVLLENLVSRFISSSVSADPCIFRPDVRIRIFVALRHWILNYFGDDFAPSENMRHLLHCKIEELQYIMKDRRDSFMLEQLMACFQAALTYYGLRSDHPKKAVEPSVVVLHAPFSNQGIGTSIARGSLNILVPISQHTTGKKHRCSVTKSMSDLAYEILDLAMVDTFQVQHEHSKLSQHHKLHSLDILANDFLQNLYHLFTSFSITPLRSRNSVMSYRSSFASVAISLKDMIVETSRLRKKHGQIFHTKPLDVKEDHENLDYGEDHLIVSDLNIIQRPSSRLLDYSFSSNATSSDSLNSLWSSPVDKALAKLEGTYFSKNATPKTVLPPPLQPFLLRNDLSLHQHRLQQVLVEPEKQ